MIIYINPFILPFSLLRNLTLISQYQYLIYFEGNNGENICVNLLWNALWK